MSLTVGKSAGAWVAIAAVVATAVAGCKKPTAVSGADAGDAASTGRATAALEQGFPADAADDGCTSTCLLRAKELRCQHPEGCEDACRKLHASTHCVRQVRAFLACFLKEPSIHWECSESGLPVLGHACEGEQANVSDCLILSEGKL